MSIETMLIEKHIDTFIKFSILEKLCQKKKSAKRISFCNKEKKYDTFFEIKCLLKK